MPIQYNYNEKNFGEVYTLLNEIDNNLLSENGNYCYGYEVGYDDLDVNKIMPFGIENTYYLRSSAYNKTYHSSIVPYYSYYPLADFVSLPVKVSDAIIRPFLYRNTQGNFSLVIASNKLIKWEYPDSMFDDTTKTFINSLDVENIKKYLWLHYTWHPIIISGDSYRLRLYPSSANTRQFSQTTQFGETFYVCEVPYNTFRAGLIDVDRNTSYSIIKQDTNIPCFEDNESICNWVIRGDRSGEVFPPSNTTCQYKLWIKGLNAPSYKVNWHNERLEDSDYNFSNVTVVLRAGAHFSDGIHYHDFLEVPWSDGSVKFTFYDLVEGAQHEDSLLFPWIHLEIYTRYDDTTKSGSPSVDLQRKATAFSAMYQSLKAGADGSTITVVNYDDDPDGYDDDDDDYHDPEDNEDPTIDPSIDIDITNELCRSYVIAPLELKKLSQFLWSDNFIDNIKLINNTPIENIVSLKAIIGSVAGGVASVLTLGNVETTSSVNACNEVHTIDVGSITIPRKYNNFLDFEPYTKISMYLPFYGTVMLDSSIVVGRTISIKYIIDVITGTGKIKILHDSKTLYEYKCTCGADLPITSSNRASVEMGYISSGIGLASSVASGNLIGGTMSLLNMAQSQFHSTTAGNCNGVLNFHDSREVTVIVDRPVYQELVNFNASHGRVCNLSKKLGDLSGFTICNENVRLNFNCLKTEEEMLRSILSSGFII